MPCPWGNAALVHTPTEAGGNFTWGTCALVRTPKKKARDGCGCARRQQSASARRSKRGAGALPRRGHPPIAPPPPVAGLRVQPALSAAAATSDAMPRSAGVRTRQGVL